jgi:diadenosine tetraphosphate (Ap4A) HIT family hydrolase
MSARYYERDGIALFCPVAPLVPGYLMLAPTRHDERPLLHRPTEALSLLLADVLSALDSRFGSSWCFEHASASADGTSCVPHAHIHLLPGVPPVALFESASRIALTNAEELADVYVRTTAGGVGIILEGRSRQHVRRIIAAGTEGGMGWDWRIHRHEAIYRETTSILLSVISDLACFVAVG